MAAKNSPRDLEAVIFSRKSGGASQKQIAQDLGVSEWFVRTVLRKSATHRVQEKVHGKVRLAKVKKTIGKTTRVAVLSDIHIPHHDQQALAVAMAYLRDYKPNVLVLNGDIADFAAPSHFPKDPHEIATFADELEETRDFLRQISSEHPKAKKFYTAANHEYRIERYLYERAPELSSFPELSIDQLLKMAEYGFHYKNMGDSVIVGDVNIFHGEIVKKHSGDSARAHMLRKGRSCLIGHVHKLGIVYRTDANGTHVAIENGHLSRPDPDYITDPDWQQGFTCLEIDESGQVAVHQHRIQNGRLVADGVVYTA